MSLLTSKFTVTLVTSARASTSLHELEKPSTNVKNSREFTWKCDADQDLSTGRHFCAVS